MFDLIVDIMGPYVLLSMTQSIVRPSRETFPGYTHTDGGEALRRIRVTESSWPLAVKALYLLTDCTAPDSGNLTVFPGSHLRRFPDKSDPPISPRSPGSAQLLGKAGDCILFPHALWHGPAPNRSGRARKTILYLRLSSAVCIPLSAFIRGSVSFAPLLPPFVVFLSKPPSPKKISKILNGLKFGPANTSAAARKKNSKKSEIFP